MQTKPQTSLSLLKDEPFIGLNRMYPNYGEWILNVCRRVGRNESLRKRTGSLARSRFVTAGFGVAVVSRPLQKIPARNALFRDLALEKGGVSCSR
jgi:hypothetical protein